MLQKKENDRADIKQVDEDLELTLQENSKYIIHLHLTN